MMKGIFPFWHDEMRDWVSSGLRLIYERLEQNQDLPAGESSVIFYLASEVLAIPCSFLDTTMNKIKFTLWEHS